MGTRGSSDALARGAARTSPQSASPARSHRLRPRPLAAPPPGGLGRPHRRAPPRARRLAARRRRRSRRSCASAPPRACRSCPSARARASAAACSPIRAPSCSTLKRLERWRQLDPDGALARGRGRRARHPPRGGSPGEGLHRRALPVVDPLLHRRRLGRRARRRPVLGPLRQDRGHGGVARVRGRPRRGGALPPPRPRAGPLPALHRQRGRPRRGHERHAAPPPRAAGARLRRLLVPQRRGGLDGDARHVPGRPAARGGAPLRSLRLVHRAHGLGAAARRRGRARRRSTGRGCPAPAASRCATVLRAPRLLNEAVDALGARVFRGSTLVLIFEGAAPTRTPADLARAAAIAARHGAALARRGAGAPLARAPLRRELPAVAHLHGGRVQRHHGGRRARGRASARSTTTCAPRSAARLRDGAPLARVPRRVQHLLHLRRQRATPRRRAGELRRRLARRARRRHRGRRHALATTTASAAARRPSSAPSSALGVYVVHALARRLRSGRDHEPGQPPAPRVRRRAGPRTAARRRPSVDRDRRGSSTRAATPRSARSSARSPPPG